MADESSRLDEIPLERLFPWVRICRGVGVAIDANKLILAVLGLLVFHLGRQGTRPAPPPPRAPMAWPAPGRPTG